MKRPTTARVEQLALGSQAAARQVRQRRRIGLAGDQRLQDGPGGDAPHVGHHGGQLHVGVLEHHLQPVGDASALLDQMGAIAGQVAELALLGRRDEAAPQQPVPEQVRDPLGVPHVRLPARDGLDVVGVGHQDGQVAFQQVVDRAPVRARALHGDMGASHLREPVQQRQQLVRHRAERPRHLLHAAISRRGQHARDDEPLVDVQPAATAMEHLHRPPPARRTSACGRRLGVRLAQILSCVLPTIGCDNGRCLGTPRPNC